MDRLKPDPKGVEALRAAARAFTRAQVKGYVWISDQGTFETCEGWLSPPEPKVANPEQLRLA
jgi:hypothetical protein